MYKNRMMSADEIFNKAMSTMAPLPSQESCARALSALFSFHLVKNELMDAGFSADELPYHHAIMVAPTGAGKTYLLRHIAKVCGVNMIFMDGSSVSRDGWKGASFSQQLLAARNAAKDDYTFARSVLFVDEFDKMRLYHDRNDGGNPQDNLLQMFNGGEVAAEAEGRQVDTIDVSRFTVIMGGAFAGLEEIIRKRMSPKANVGFGAAATGKELDDRAILHYATPGDLQKYGMKKELIARIGSILHINPLAVEDYRHLLTAEAGSVQANYRNYFSHGFGVDFDISEEAICQIAEQCSQATTGARAVTPIVNEAMRTAFAEVDKDRTINKVVLTANTDGCFVEYEHGDRGVVSLVDADHDIFNSYDISGNSALDIAETLYREYLATKRDQDFTQEFGVFVRMSLTYLQTACRKPERHFENLRKFATATHKSAKSQLSPYEIIISDYLQRPDCDPDMKEWFEDFRKLWSRDTAQRLSRALTAIRLHLVQEHGTSDIRFNAPEVKRTKPSAPDTTQTADTP